MVMRPSRAGFTLIELVLVLALVAILAAAGLPRLFDATAAWRVRLAAQELVGTLRTARTLALREGTHVAVKFFPQEDGTVSFAFYQDGDGDGVRNRDIADGTDREIRPPRRLSHLGGRVGFGLPPGRPPRDPGNPRRQLPRLEDPIRFNRSDLASFSPLGESTPGSLYLSDGRNHLAVVRVFGRTGKVKVLVYDFRTETWKGP